MKTSLLVPLTIVAAAGFAGWMIRDEGEATREAMQSSVATGVDRAGDRIEAAVDREADLVDRVVAMPVEILGEIAREGGDVSGAPDSAGTPDDGGESDLIGGLLSTGYRVVRTADEAGRRAFRLPEEERRRIGLEIREQVRSEFDVVEDAALDDRLRRLVGPLIASGDGAPEGVTVTVLDSDELNAFSHIGGHVYVHRGLVELAESDVELQFVLGHEVAHIALGHCDAAFAYARQAGRIGGDLAGSIAQAAHSVIALGYSEEQEYDCDAWAYETLRRLGRSHEDGLSFMTRFRDELLAQGIEAPDHPGAAGQDQATPIDRAFVAMLDHFASHPPASRRIDRLDRLRTKPVPAE